MRHAPFSLLLLCALAAFADKPAPETLPHISVPPCDQAPTIDGILDDAAWDSAAVIQGLRPALNAPVDDPALPDTTVQLLWTPTALYVAFACTDSEIFHTGTLQNDDNLYTEDVVEVFLDGVGDGRQFVEIQVSPSGAHLDMMYVYSTHVTAGEDGRIDPTQIHRDRWGFREWNMPGLQTAAARTPNGWSVELRIPAETIVRRLGQKIFDTTTPIHANFVRYDHVPDPPSRRLVQQFWSPVLWGNPHNSPFHMGQLHLSDESSSK